MTKQLLTPVLVFSLLLFAILGCRSTNQTTAPSWSKAKVLSDNEDHPSKIVSDGKSVFFVTGGTMASKNEGTNNIKSISLSDGRVSVLVKGGDVVPSSTLAVDVQYVYWSDGGNILRVPKAGGNSEKIVINSPQPEEMVLDNESMYWLLWTGEGSPPAPIMFAPKNGGAAKQLTPPQPPTSGIALDGDVIYWMTGDGIKRIPKGGGEIMDFYRHAFKQPSLGLQQDVENFYFCQMNERGHSALMKLNKKSGELTQLVPSVNHTMEFVVADGNVYYFDEVPKTGSFGPVALRRVSTKGGDPVEIDQGNAGWIKHLAVDEKQIYFTDISRVYALPK
jgi:hypothetical protein